MKNIETFMVFCCECLFFFAFENKSEKSLNIISAYGTFYLVVPGNGVGLDSFCGMIYTNIWAR